MPSSVKPTPWRLLPALTTSGAQQMAIDAWLLNRYFPRTGRSVLRFYRWQPAAISLGYLQKCWPQQWQAINWQGHPLELVKRPSGGRAVLHQGSLTYAVVTGYQPGQRQQRYQQICQFLLQGWGQLGVPLTYGQGGRGYIHNASCFNTATPADLVTRRGDKLIGSAQRHTPQALLQHGSMVLTGDRQLFQQVFGQPAPWRQGLQALAPQTTIDTILSTLTASAEQCFNCQLEPEPLTGEEWAEIGQLTPQFVVTPGSHQR